MWKNFLKVAIRSISKNKASNVINIAGLAIGLASAIFIILYIISETSFDRFHTRSNDIYRLYLDGKMAGEEFKGAWNSPIFGPTFHEEIPEASHNAIVSYRLPSEVARMVLVVYLRSPNFHPRVALHYEFSQRALADARVEHAEVQAEGRSALAQAMSAPRRMGTMVAV